jgi:hypothetical protein
MDVPQTQNKEERTGRAIAFRYDQEFSGASRPVISLLYLFEFDGWLVKYRITFAADQEEKAFLVSQVFVSAFKWRGDAR